MKLNSETRFLVGDEVLETCCVSVGDFGVAMVMVGLGNGGCSVALGNCGTRGKDILVF